MERNNIKQTIIGALCAMVLLPLAGYTQLAYTFQAVQGNTFSALPSNTAIVTQSFDDEVYVRTLSPGFTFNGTLYTQLHISANGFVAFGLAPAGTDYTPLSSAAAYAGVISVFGADLVPATSGGNNRRINFRQNATEIAVQWQQVRRKDLNESFTVGIRLVPATGQIILEYGSLSGPDASTANQPQVGLRGVNNVLDLGNVKNRMVGTGAGQSWLNSLDGTANTSTARFTSTNPARFWNLGLNYIYSTCIVGQACDDGDACTNNDQLDANCNCVGTFQDADNDGVCDVEDGCPNDPEKTEPGVCGCGVADVDSDEDGSPDCVDGCPNDPNKIAPGICGCGVADVDSDNDGTLDCSDDCPNDPDKIAPGNCGCGNPEPGASCDDGDPSTENDAINANCVCAGTPISSGCTPMRLLLHTDLNGADITWTITDALTQEVLCSGGPYVNGVQVNAEQTCCVPDGGHVFNLMDSAGDGMLNGFNGGYQLQTMDGRRLIDNTNNGDFGSVSRVTGNDYSFSMPMGSDRLIHVSCDKYWWKSGEFVVANENPLVSAEWVVGGTNAMQPADSGYEFWFYAPNGGYSFRKLRNHRTADGAGSGALRACHLKVNNWSSAMHVPDGVLLNVKVRGRVQGVNQPWGPACRFVRDEVLAQCPPTKLMDIPGNQFLSCGQFRQFVSNQRVHCRPVSGASQYQFRFRVPGEGAEIIRTSSTYYVNLGWSASVAPPLVAGITYEVDVRAMRNGQWCGTSEPWGDVCSLTISPAVGGGGVNMAGEGEDATAPEASLRMWPNPSTDGIVWVDVQTTGTDANVAQLEVYNMSGQRVSQQLLQLNDGVMQAQVELGQLGNGVYLVQISAGSAVRMERLVIQR